MNEHVMSSKKDVDSRLSMRKAIFARAKHLRYIRKKWPLRYDQLLVDIGVDPSTVEGELKTML
jgi:ribosomal protein S15P/S13E